MAVNLVPMRLIGGVARLNRREGRGGASGEVEIDEIVAGRDRDLRE